MLTDTSVKAKKKKKKNTDPSVSRKSIQSTSLRFTYSLLDLNVFVFWVRLHYSSVRR